MKRSQNSEIRNQKIETPPNPRAPAPTASKHLLASGFWLLVSCFLILNFCLNFNSAFAKSKKRVKTPQKVEQTEIKKEEPEPKISSDVTQALARGNLNEAAIELREQRTSAKSLYLLREVTRIVMYQTSKGKPKRSDAHQFYQNLGIAYHNLFLFLKANGYTQEKFANEAIKFYKKSRGSATPMHKQETDILMAALLISNGEDGKAEKIIKKVDMTKLGADFQTQEYLAAYYAAKGDAYDATEALKAAYRERPDVILTWLAVGDDFHIVKDDPRFVALLNEWNFKKSAKKLDFKLPPPTAPKLQFAEPAVQFRHPTAPQAQPHYKMSKKKIAYLKAHSKTHKKAATVKTSSNTKKTVSKKK